MHVVTLRRHYQTDLPLQWRHNGRDSVSTWWRHQMETFSALLAICAGISPVPVKSPHKCHWRGALMFSLICVWINGWVNNREAGDLRRYRAHYDVIVMNHHPRDCLLNHLFRGRSNKASKLRVTGLFVWGIHRRPVNSPHKWPVSRKMFPFDDVIMLRRYRAHYDVIVMANRFGNDAENVIIWWRHHGYRNSVSEQDE